MSDQQNLDPKPGIYTARAVKGSEQYGESTNGSPELLLQLDIPDIGKRLTTVLYFSAAAAPYSIERLRAMGWEGSDLADLSGIDKKDVSIEITYEPFEGEAQDEGPGPLRWRDVQHQEAGRPEGVCCARWGHRGPSDYGAGCGRSAEAEVLR